MKDSDRTKFASLLKGLQMMFRSDKKLVPEVVETYWRVFQGWDIKQFSAACDRLLKIKTIPTFPLPAEIIQASINENAGLTAWYESRAAVRRHGAWMNVEFTDYRTARTIQNMGGWIRFCSYTDQEIPWMQKEFERIYDLFGDSDEILLLRGTCDLTPKNIVRIGRESQKEITE